LLKSRKGTQGNFRFLAPPGTGPALGSLASVDLSSVR
jgi:hypothetical protein